MPVCCAALPPLVVTKAAVQLQCVGCKKTFKELHSAPQCCNKHDKCSYYLGPAMLCAACFDKLEVMTCSTCQVSACVQPLHSSTCTSMFLVTAGPSQGGPLGEAAEDRHLCSPPAVADKDLLGLAS